VSRAKRIQPSDVFRGLQPGDDVQHVALYPDGHCVVRFSRYLDDLRKSVSYIKQAETIGLTVRIYDATYEHPPGGRVSFWGNSVALLRAMIAAGATRLDAFPGIPREDRSQRPASLDFTTSFGVVSVQQTDDVNANFHPDPTWEREPFDATLDHVGDYRVVETVKAA
jgi:hypothetical protein